MQNHKPQNPTPGVLLAIATKEAFRASAPKIVDVLKSFIERGKVEVSAIPWLDYIVQASVQDDVIDDVWKSINNKIYRTVVVGPKRVYTLPENTNDSDARFNSLKHPSHTKPAHKIQELIL